MWTSRVMRYGVIPAIFLVVGPPAGAVTLVVLSLVTSVDSWRSVGGFLLIVPLSVAVSYAFGGLQALLVGLVAAATVRRRARVRAVPVLLVALVLGLALPTATSLREMVTGDVVLTAAALAAVHLAGAAAGLALCRLVERPARPRA